MRICSDQRIEDLLNEIVQEHIIHQLDREIWVQQRFRCQSVGSLWAGTHSAKQYSKQGQD